MYYTCSLLMWSMVTLFCALPKIMSQTGDSDLLIDLTCDTGYQFITQPPAELPCNPYSATSGNTTSIRLECSVLVPKERMSNSCIVWSKLKSGSTKIKELNSGKISMKRRNIGNITISSDVVFGGGPDPASTVLLRSILKVDGLMQNNTEYVGRYFCHVELEDGGTVIVSNTSTATIIDESSTYTNRERCFEDGLFLNLASNGPCLSFSSNVVPPTSDEGSEETTMGTSPGTSSVLPTTPAILTAVPLSTEAMIIIGSVGGGLALVVCVLLFILCTTCCCLRKPNKGKASLRIFKDRSIPRLTSSTSNINMVEHNTSQLNLTTPLDNLFSTQPVPPRPPPVMSTLPNSKKRAATQMDSNDGSIASSTVLIRKGRPGRAATVIGRLKNACTPTDEENTLEDIVSLAGSEPDYKSLIVTNMDEIPIYTTASLHGSTESLDRAIDDQPVYSEPTIPLSVSMLSIVSQEDSDEGTLQYAYAKPTTLPHSTSCLSLHCQSEGKQSEIVSRTRLSLPLNRKLAVRSFVHQTAAEEDDQPIYSEVSDLEVSPPPLPTRNTADPIDKLPGSHPRPHKKGPAVAPRPPGRHAHKPEKKISQDNPSPPEKTDQSETQIQRESVDGEYVYPNGMVNIRETRSQRLQEVAQLGSHKKIPPPHKQQEGSDTNHGYLILYKNEN